MKETPTKLKQKQVEPKLKVWLLQGKTITHNQAQKMWNTNRLAVFIGRLKAKGMRIEMKMTSENGEVFGVYKLITTPKESRITNRSYMDQAYSKTLK